MVISFRADTYSFNPGDVDLTKIYENQIDYGQYFTYEINNITNIAIQPFLSKLTITLESVTGDADLFVSLTNSNPLQEDCDYSSRSMLPIDQVVIVDNGGDILNRPIFFSVFGVSIAQVRITFSYEFKASYNQQLDRAVPIGDSNFLYQSLPDEKAEGFYSF